MLTCRYLRMECDRSSSRGLCRCSWVRLALREQVVIASEGQGSLGMCWVLKGEQTGRNIPIRENKEGQGGGRSAGWGVQHYSGWAKLEFWVVEEEGGTRGGPEERSRATPSPPSPRDVIPKNSGDTSRWTGEREDGRGRAVSGSPTQMLLLGLGDWEKQWGRGGD